MVDLAPLAGAHLLADLAAEHLDDLAAMASEIEVAAGSYVFRAGDLTDTLYIVREGTLELIMPVTVLAAEREVPIDRLAMGDGLAWSALVPPHRLTMSARARTDARLIGLVRSKLLELFASKPGLGCTMLHNLTVLMGRRLDLTMNMWFAELQRSVTNKFG